VVDQSRTYHGRLKRIGLFRRLRSLGSTGRSSLVAIATILVIGMETPWLQPVVRKLGFEDLQGTGVAIIVFILSLVYFDLRRIAGRQSKVIDQYFPDATSMYPTLLDRARRVTRVEDKQIDILGTTLDTAWPMLKFWLNSPEGPGWRIRMCALLDESGRFSAYTPQEWCNVARTNLNDAVRTSESLANSRRDISITVYSYDFLPAVHGIRLGNGDLLFAVLSWGRDGKIGSDSYGYQFVPAEDRSGSANAMRSTFSSWFDRACIHPWPRNVADPSSMHPAVRVDATADKQQEQTH
jgi:hypothetical protein